MAYARNTQLLSGILEMPRNRNRGVSLPVVEDLGDGVSVGDRVLQVRHEHEVPRVVPVVVDGVVVDVAQDGLQGVRG